MAIFVIGMRKLFPRHIKKKRYAHQVFGNVGNFQIAYSDSIVVSTHKRGLLLLHLYARFPTTSKLRRGIAVPRFVVNKGSCGSWRITITFAHEDY